MSPQPMDHGAGARGRKGCDCDICLNRRRQYEREYKQQARRRLLDRNRTPSTPTYIPGTVEHAIQALQNRADDGWRGMVMSLQAQQEVETLLTWAHTHHEPANSTTP